MPERRFGRATALRIAKITSTTISSMMVKPLQVGLAFRLVTPVNSIRDKRRFNCSDDFAIFFRFVFNNCLIVIGFV